MMYDDLVKRLRSEAVYLPEKFSKNAELLDVLMKAADAIEDLEFACNRYEKDYKALCEYLPKWIPVTERLPENGTEVLSLVGDNGMEVALYGEGICDGWYTTSEKLSGVTHWMPLPQPPKEG